MIWVLLSFLVLAVLVLVSFRVQWIPLDPIQEWRQWSRFASVRLAILAGSMEGLSLTAQQLKDALDGLDGIAQLHAITTSPEYHAFTTGITLFIVVARVCRQKPKGD